MRRPATGRRDLRDRRLSRDARAADNVGPRLLLSLLATPIPSATQGSGSYTGLSCTRASAKTVMNGSGVLAQLGNNAVAIDALGLLSEVAHSQLARDSDGIANWVAHGTGGVQNASLSSGFAGPDGSSTSACKLIEDSSNGTHQLYQFEDAPDYLTQLGVFRVKAGTRSWVFIYNNSGGNQGVYFNLSAGTVGSASNSKVSGNIKALGNGWYECSVFFDTTIFPAGNYQPIVLSPATGDGGVSYAGDGASYVYVHSVDFFETYHLLSHVVNATTSIGGASAAADVVTVPSASLPTGQGRIEMDFTPNWSQAHGNPVIFDSRSGGQGLALIINAGQQLNLFYGGCSIGGTVVAFAPGTTVHVTAKWKGVYGEVFVNGVSLGNYNGCTPITSHGTLHLGCDQYGANQCDGHVANVQVWSS